ncbi:MAG: penicillin-binding protein 2 [Holosporales bacterium]|jgi:penicillin-binding protein 2|nr:penicillin-binding protein 2 [Holosporales bacterium]
MGRKREEKRLITRRTFLFAGIKIFLGMAIVSRLFYLQIFKFSHYKLLSDKNRLVLKRILPSRGNIFDASGKLLASNKFTYSAILDVLEIPQQDRASIIKRIIKDRSLDPKTADDLMNIPEVINRNNRLVLLQEDLSWDELAGYYVMASSMQGIVIEKVRSRTYLFPEALSHITGYIGAPTKEQVTESDNIALSLPMVKVGKNCIEQQYEEELFGKIGVQCVEVNSRRQLVRCVSETDSIPGDDIHLTINLDLQLEVYKILSQHESASCVVMDVNTGAILAFVSYPGYDTNIFTKKIDPKTLEELYNNPFKPIINKVIAGLYAPGSAFKMMTGLAGLSAGVITKHTRFHCSGVHKLDSHKFHCWKWKYNGHGYIDLRRAISESCDVYFYNLAEKIGPDIIARTANDFGLGFKTGIDLPGEKAGLIPTKEWKKERKGQSWTKGDTLNMAIGQGFDLTTPLQLTRMIAILVNGLNPITPVLRKSKETLSPEKLKYKPEHVELILDGMYDVVNSSTGTARFSAIDDEDFEMAGKTGSSQVYHITESQRQAGKTVSDDYWMKEHAVFVGYAPADDPKFAVTVLVEHGGGGAKTAAPIARDVLGATRSCSLRR